MSLISIGNMLVLQDDYGAAYNLLKTQLGLSTDTIVPGNVRNLINNALVTAVNLADATQEIDLVASNSLQNAILNLTANILSPSYLRRPVDDLNSHCQKNGGLVAASITSIDTFMSYYNGGGGGLAFSNPATYDFAQLYFVLYSKLMTYPNQLYDVVNSLWSSTLYPKSFGSISFNGTYSAGFADIPTGYCEQNLVAQVTSSFSGGTSQPFITVSGIDNTGAAMTWTAQLTSQSASPGTPSSSSSTSAVNNPAGMLTGVVTQSAINAQQRQTIPLNNTSTIVPGSVLTINSGLIDQEVIEVESVAGQSITAAFKKAHSNGAAVSGLVTVSMTPATAGRRARSISNISIGGGSWSAGTIEVAGVSDRIAI